MQTTLDNPDSSTQTADVLLRSVSNGRLQSLRGDIDPFRITGFREAVETRRNFGGKVDLKGNPLFKNPRINSRDQKRVDAIQSDPEIYDPIECKFSSDNRMLDAIDGDTRLSAVVQEYADNPGTTKFATVPYRVRQGLEDREYRALAVERNFEDAKTPLNPMEQALAINALLNEDGFTKDELCKSLKITITRINALLNLLTSPEEVQEAVASGEITLTEAKSAIKQGQDGAANAVEAIKEAKKGAPKGPKQSAAKTAGLKKGNVGTLGLKNILTGDLVTTILPKVKKLHEAGFDDEIGYRQNIVKTGSKDAILNMIESAEFMAMWSVYTSLIRTEDGEMLSDLEFDQQVSWLEKHSSK